MSDETIYKILENLGDDAKGIMILYLLLDYGSLLLVIALITWGVRTLWIGK